MNQRQKSLLSLGVIRNHLYGGYFYPAAQGYLHHVCQHPDLRDAPEKLTEYENRIINGGELTDDELGYLKFLYDQIVHYLKTGELEGTYVKHNGVWEYKLMSNGTV